MDWWCLWMLNFQAGLSKLLVFSKGDLGGTKVPFPWCRSVCGKTTFLSPCTCVLWTYFLFWALLFPMRDWLKVVRHPWHSEVKIHLCVPPQWWPECVHFRHRCFCKVWLELRIIEDKVFANHRNTGLIVLCDTPEPGSLDIGLLMCSLSLLGARGSLVRVSRGPLIRVSRGSLSRVSRGSLNRVSRGLF